MQNVSPSTCFGGLGCGQLVAQPQEGQVALGAHILDRAALDLGDRGLRDFGSFSDLDLRQAVRTDVLEDL